MNLDALKVEMPRRYSVVMILTLGLFSLVCCVLLVIGAMYTKGAIAERHLEDRVTLLSQVLPIERHLPLTLQIKDETGQVMSVDVLAQAGEISYLALPAVAHGYSGDIQMVVGLSRDGTISGVRVLSHAETPGLGDKIDITRSDWINAFNGLSLSNTTSPEWAVKKDGGRFDQFTGATITPRGVVREVKRTLDWYSSHRQQILSQLQQQFAAIKNKEASDAVSP